MAQNDVVVVLGGAGFIGRHLVEQLRGKVREIRVVSRSAAGPDEPGVRHLRGDVSNAARMLEVIEGATVVHQLTIEDQWTEGARNVAEACLRHGVRRHVFASTSDALFLGRRGTIMEDEAPDPKPELRNSYSRGKGASERLLLEYFRNKRLPVVIVRPCLVVGPGGRMAHGGIGSWVSGTCLLGWGTGHNPMPFVLVQDVADAMLRAMDAPGVEGHAFNLAGDVFLSAREYVQLLRDNALRDFRFFSRNLLWNGLTVTLKGLVRGLIEGRAVERQRYRDMISSAMITQIDNSASKKLLGWQPNASREVFIREAIGSHLEPIPPGDLRLEAPGGR